MATGQIQPVRSPSVREIARIAGVSPATVSRVINKDRYGPQVREATRRKVLRVCQRLNYQPNIHATRLFAKRSNAIAFVVPTRGKVLPHFNSFTDPNLAKTLAGLTEAAARHEQELVLMAIDQAFLESKRYLRVLRSRSVDGMIIWGTRMTDVGFIREIVEEGWPLVLTNGMPCEDGSTPTIQSDNRTGAAALARRLIELGHRRIAFLSGPATAYTGMERLRGFEQVCREAGVTLDIHEGKFTFESGKTLAGQLLDGKGRQGGAAVSAVNNTPDGRDVRPTSFMDPTAIACVNDLVALGAIDAAQQRGLRVPEDLSVTGADDAYPYYKPRLTTFRAPMEDLGGQALLALLERIAADEDVRGDGDDAPASSRILPVEMVAGRTVAPP